MGACVSVEIGRDSEEQPASSGRGDARGTKAALSRAKSDANGRTQPALQGPALPRASSANAKKTTPSKQGAANGGKPGTRPGAGARAPAGAAAGTGTGAGAAAGAGTGSGAGAGAGGGTGAVAGGGAGARGGGVVEAGSAGELWSGDALGHAALRRFTLRELSAATGRFRRENEVGEGSFGKVYRGAVDEWLGELPPGHRRMVAVKVLDENSFQGFGEWMAEVLLLGRLKHQNLVRLLGYCTEKDEAALVYDFLPNGSLDAWLFDQTRRALTWEERMGIARGATEGLGYLHAQNVIHRDFKSCNILLDDNMGAKLTDFGMATTGPEGGETHVSTRVMGTLGYLDPKYMETGHLTPKSDIYALGVVFLELLTGRPPTADPDEGWPPGGDGEGAGGGVRLTMWIRPHLNQRRPDLSVIMDPRLQGQYSPLGAHKMLVLAKHCVSEDPAARPQIAEMLRTVRQVADLATSLPEDASPRAPQPQHQQQQQRHQQQQQQQQPQQQQYQQQQLEAHQVTTPPPQQRVPVALQQQQRQNSLQRGGQDESTELHESEASLGHLGPLEGRLISSKSKKRGTEEASFDATRSLFKDVASPR